MNDPTPKFTMTIDLNVLNHLGMNLYSNIPAVISEVVANAWDADAEEVKITIGDSEIVIQDNGSGMDIDDINKKFLVVGYQRRVEKEGRTTLIHTRPVMGRKGIGKLSLFSIANKIRVYSKKDGQSNAFLMDAEEIQKRISSPSKSIDYAPMEIDASPIDFEKGTRIVLSELKKRRTVTQDIALKKRLARRFSIIGPKNKFQVWLNGTEVTVADRDYFHKIEYLWYYGDESVEYDALATKKSNSEKRPNLLNGGYRLTGWLGLVKESGDLTDGDDNLNKIVLIVRGKMAKEDMLEEFREGGLFSKYLFGEIRADFLDDSDQPDIATSSRQDIFEEDERYKALKDFLWDELKHIQRKREDYKSNDAEKELEKLPSVNAWYKGLEKETKSRAKKFMGRINQIAVDEQHKKQLISHGVLAFESFRYKDSLESLEKVSLENLDEFLRIFKEFDEIDATLYYKITEGRLGVIRELRNKVLNENALEKALQSLLFDHLWLLDPSWERSTETPLMEQRVETEFGKITANLTEEEQKGRMDIKYKTPAGKHIVVELKRASVKTDSYDLQKQVDKYIWALEKILKEVNPAETPVIEAICVVGKPLKDWDTTEHTKQAVDSMAAKRTRVVTYQKLIENAERSYSEYLAQNQKTNKLLQIIQNIENEISM